MKISAEREALLACLQSVVNVVERRQTMPILSNLLLKAADSTLFVTATDLELEISAEVTVTVDEPGAATVPARKLTDIIRGLPAGADIRMALREQRFHVTSGRSRFALATLSATEFPFLDRIESGLAVQPTQKTLKRLLDQTYFAMAHQDVRYYLNGLLLVLEPQLMRAVATDGHRLAISQVTETTGVEEPMQIIVPRKAVAELQRLLELSDEAVTLTLSQSHLRLEFHSLRFTTKLIDGRFPDYERVLPDMADKRVTADRELVRQALTRTAILSNEKVKGVRLSLDENRLRFQAQNPEHEEAEDEIEVDYTSEPVEIGFNINYLLDALSAIRSEEFTLDLVGPDSSGLLQAKDDGSSRYVVMPMRL